MISTAVIPRIAAAIAGGALDPYSETHVRRVVHLSEEVEASVESGNVKLQVRQSIRCDYLVTNHIISDAIQGGGDVVSDGYCRY